MLSYPAVPFSGCPKLPNQDDPWPECAHVRSTVLLNVLDPVVDIEQKIHDYKTAIIQETIEWIDEFNERHDDSLFVEYLSPVPIRFAGIVILIEAADENDARRFLQDDTDDDMSMDTNEESILAQALLNKGQIRDRKVEFDVTAVHVVSQHPRRSNDDKPENFVHIIVSGLTRNVDLYATEIDVEEYKQDLQKDLAISKRRVLEEAQRLGAGDAGYPATTYFGKVKLSVVTDDSSVRAGGIMADLEPIDLVVKEFQDPVEEEDFQWYLFVVAGGILLLLFGALTCACVCGNHTTHPAMEDAVQDLLSSPHQQGGGNEPVQAGNDNVDEPLQPLPNEPEDVVDAPFNDIDREKDDEDSEPPYFEEKDLD